MGLFDRFKPKREQLKKEKKVRHAVDEKSAKEAAFAAVPSAGAPEKSQPKETEAKKISRPKKNDTRLAYRILIRPMVTEKTTQLRTQNRYAFAVATDANKLSVKEAVLALYGVRPASVTIQRFRGRQVRYGRTQGKTKAWKRAIVTLPSGKTIDPTEA